MSTALESVPTQTIRDLLASQQVISAFRFFDDSAEAITEEQIRICSDTMQVHSQSSREPSICEIDLVNWDWVKLRSTTKEIV